MQHHYHIDLAWSDEDQTWIARFPGLMGIVLPMCDTPAAGESKQLLVYS